MKTKWLWTAVAERSGDTASRRSPRRVHGQTS